MRTAIEAAIGDTTSNAFPTLFSSTSNENPNRHGFAFSFLLGITTALFTSTWEKNICTFLRPGEVNRIKIPTPKETSNLIICYPRWQPTRAPAPWKGVLQAASPGPVCPQRLPDVEDEREAMERMPRARLRSVKDVFVQHHDEILIFTVFPLI